MTGLGTLPGRVKQSSNWEDSFLPLRRKAIQYETTWEHATIRDPVCDRGNRRILYSTTETRPIEHRGDMRPRRPSPYCATHCVRTIGGQESSVTQASAVEWSDGVQLQAKGFALHLTSQTGYSTSARLDFAFKRRGKACAQFDDPRSTDGRMIGSLLAR